MWMPFRSAKMKRRIFGFQRRVWWPKWTPALRSSSIVGSAMMIPCVWLVSSESVVAGSDRAIWRSTRSRLDSPEGCGTYGEMSEV